MPISEVSKEMEKIYNRIRGKEEFEKSSSKHIIRSFLEGLENKGGFPWL